MTEDATQVVRIERTFDAPAEDVFDAWTSADVIRRWFRPGRDWGTPSAEVDLRVGGTVRVVMRSPDGSDYPLHGTFLEVAPPDRLVPAVLHSLQRSITTPVHTSRKHIVVAYLLLSNLPLATWDTLTLL